MPASTTALTDKQQEILNLIRRLILETGQSPTVREIAEAAGLSSSCTVQRHLVALEKKGYVRKSRYKYRSIELVDDFATVRKPTVNVPLVGRVAAGAPILASENIEEVLPLPGELVPSSGELFALRVKGQSMRDAGIHDGDLIVARRQNVARDGEKVVALIEDEATVKTFYNDGPHVRLQPENPEFEPILTRDAQILGKVVMAIKQF